MKLQVVDIQTFGGPSTMRLPANGETVTFKRDVNHADWKTASVFPERWPAIKQGTKVKVVGFMQNLYGVFIKVEANGSVYDVESNLILY